MSNLGRAIQTLQLIRNENEEFREWLDITKQNSDFPLTNFSDLLCLPAQRITKYTEIVDGLFEFSIQQHKENSLKEVGGKHKVRISSLEFDQIKDLQEAKNALCRKREEVAKMLENDVSGLYDKLIGLSFKIDDSLRSFIREGELLWKGKTRKYFLLSDYLVLTRSDNRVKEELRIKDLSISNEILRDESELYFYVYEQTKNEDKKKKTRVGIKENDTELHKLLQTYIDIGDRSKVLFGVSLVVLEKRQVVIDGVPTFVRQAAEYITSNDNIKTEGMFRKNGNAHDIQLVKEKFEQGEKEVNFKNPHVACGLLKLFFRELPDSLIPYSLYDSLMSLVLNDSNTLSNIRVILRKLPKINSQLLYYLCKFFNKIAKYEEDNLMSVENLSLVFSGNLIRPVYYLSF
eukprot:TRINITY_DN6031_c0_g1_i2.p1 TRINITY_DN6031_c0_g1~~TRINITY_DN6031_c0_g1_i2.p1  ORF type:complete len:403 (-),score=77.21 TRINITY_DN6031_c0_g1_i2:24-1232(-)